MSLRVARLNRGLSVEDVATAVGIPTPTYYYYERTGGMPRDAATAKRIADLLGAQVSDLWEIRPPNVERQAV